MFKKVISYKGFWRSVLLLAILFIAVFIPLQWAFSGFEADYFVKRSALKLIAQYLIGGFIYGFAVTYGKFWQKLKEEEYKK